MTKSPPNWKYPARLSTKRCRRPRRAVTKKARRPPVWMKQCEALIVQTNLSVRQIAAHLGISRATIYNKFPASRIEELRKEKGAIE